MKQPPADRAEGPEAARGRAEIDSVSAGRWCVVLAALLWSTSGLFAKAPLFDAWEPATRGPVLAFWRALFAGLFLLPWASRPRWRWQLLPLLVAFVGMNYTYLSALVLTTAANAIWLQCTAPWWVALLGWLVWNEPPTRRDAAPLVLGLAGVALILRFELSSGARWGTICALTAAVFYAVVLLSLRALRAEHGVWLVVLTNLCSACCLSPLAIVQGTWPRGIQWGVLMLFGVGQIGLPYLLMARGLRTVPSVEASALVLLEPVLLPLWVYLTWGEIPAWWTAAGAGCILLGLLVRYAWPAPREGSAR